MSSKYGFWILVYTRAWIRIEGIFVHYILMKYLIKFPITKTFKNVIPTIVSAISMGILGYFLQQINESII